MSDSTITISPALQTAVYRIWQQIAPDLNEVESNEEAIEVCLDADRLDPRSGFSTSLRAYNEYHELVAAHGLQKVREALAKLLPLA